LRSLHLCGKLCIMDDKKAAIIKILETAIQQEKKAKEFYLKMSAQLTNKEAQSRFRHMAEAEQEHEDILKSWYEEMCGYPFDMSKIQLQENKSDISEPDRNATLMDVIKVIARVENRAFRFYKRAAVFARTLEEKRMFERLADLEHLHADQSSMELQMAANENLHFSEGDIPWNQ